MKDQQDISKQVKPVSEVSRKPGSDDKKSGSSAYLRDRLGILNAPLAQLAIIFLAGLFIYCLWLGDSPLYRTEPFRALVAHQMVHGSSWLIPHLYGELYQRKPPLIYWIQGGVELLAGHGNEFIWRLPSAVGSALLAVFLAWWAGRWFGNAARLPTGFACLALVAMWDQNRGADIDALNTVFAMLGTVCVLELLCGKGRWSAGWSLGLGLSLGAALLLKGPGTLPQVIAAIIGPAFVLRNWKLMQRLSVWIGILIGFAIFTSYILTAKIAMHRAGIVADKTGWYEIIEKIFLHGWWSRLKAFGLPFQLLIFALPVSAVLPFAVVLIRRLPRGDESRARAMAIMSTLGATLLIWLVDGNDNPRYEYVMLPLLAPLVGFVWALRAQIPNVFSQMLLGVCALLCGADVLVTVKLPNQMPEHLVALVGMGLSVLVLIWVVAKTLAAKAASPVGGIAVVVLLLLFAFPMAARKNAERRKKSAANASVALRQAIGNALRVSAAGVVRDLPELFYYANVDVDSYGEFGLPKLAAVRGGHWVVISENEKYPAYSTIQKYIPGALTRVTKLPMPDARDVIYVGWYDPPANADTRIEWHVEKPTVEPDE